MIWSLSACWNSNKRRHKSCKSADSRKLDLIIIYLSERRSGEKEEEGERIRGFWLETKAYHTLDLPSIVTCFNKSIGINISYAYYCTLRKTLRKTLPLTNIYIYHKNYNNSIGEESYFFRIISVVYLHYSFAKPYNSEAGSHLATFSFLRNTYIPLPSPYFIGKSKP